MTLFNIHHDIMEIIVILITWAIGNAVVWEFWKFLSDFGRLKNEYLGYQLLGECLSILFKRQNYKDTRLA